jgi:hypothetical protein
MLTPRAVERYWGPWNAQLKNVVLVIGNQGNIHYVYCQLPE